jgi:hypothetical protein
MTLHMQYRCAWKERVLVDQVSEMVPFTGKAGTKYEAEQELEFREKWAERQNRQFVPLGIQGREMGAEWPDLEALMLPDSDSRIAPE